MSKFTNVIDVEDGSIIEWEKPLSPEMLTGKGLIAPTAIKGVKVRYGREYVIGKLRHDVVEALQIKNFDELIPILLSIVTD